MAMNGTAMGDEIAAAILAGDATAEGTNLSKQFWEKVGNAIVNHIVTNCEVVAGIAVSTTGSSTSQSGATTENGTVI